MIARVKKMNFPDAPTPTKPMRVYPSWEERHYESLAKGPELGCFKEKEPYTKWSKEDLDTIERMWCEGRMAKDIAPKVGGNIRATQNKITYMISKGILPKRRSTISDEECEQIREEREYLTVPKICKLHNISQDKVKRICKTKKP